jgi:hypothetical protein
MKTSELCADEEIRPLSTEEIEHLRAHSRRRHMDYFRDTFRVPASLIARYCVASGIPVPNQRDTRPLRVPAPGSSGHGDCSLSRSLLSRPLLADGSLYDQVVCELEPLGRV